MALIGSLAISMSANTQKFEKGLNSAAKSLGGFVSSVTAGLKTVGLFGAGLTIAGGYAMTKMIEKASDLRENVNKLEAIFGKDSKSIVEQANLMAEAFGTSAIEFTDAAARMGGLLKGAGYSAADAAKLSVAMVKLSNDASSFFNTDFDTAFNKIRSGLAGEAEPLRDFGVMLTEDTVKAYAYSHGLAKLNAELSIGQKTQARLGLITQGLADAQGDAAKTADGVANSSRGLWGRLENLATIMGETLLPVAEVLLKDMQVGVEALTMLWNDNSTAVTDWGKSALSASGGASSGISFLQKAIGWVADAYHYAAIVWKSVVKDFLYGAAKVVEGLSKIWDTLSTINPALLLLSDSKGIKSMADQIKGLGDTWNKSFVDEVNKPLPHEDVDKYFDEARKKIQAARSALAQPGEDLSNIAPASTAPLKKMAEAKYASATDRYSKEGVNMILRSQYGSAVAKSTAADQTAKNTARTNVVLETIATGIQAIAGKGVDKAASAFNAASAGGLGWF